PYFRQTSVTLIPLSTSFRMRMICSSLYRVPLLAMKLSSCFHSIQIVSLCLVQFFGGQISDRDQEVRSIAIHALTRIGDARVLPQIQARLSDYSAEVRSMAATSLGIFRFTESTSALLKTLDDPDDL